MTMFPSDWYWLVGQDKDRWWSSNAAAYVDKLPDGARPSLVVSEAELWDVLRERFPDGLPANDAAIERQKVSNRATLLSQATAALEANRTFLAISSPLAAQNAAQVKALTRQMNALVRLVAGVVDGTD